ncbi:ptc1 [Symbiodinium sp. KB8]|nr:ptc1 [Symbiodinium sp. KB8]
MNHAATTGRAAAARGRGQDSAKEMLQQLPVALGGYRPGHNDTAPGPKQRGEAQRQAPRGPSHEPPWMQQNRRGARADVAVVPPWAQDTFTMPFPRKREGEAHRKRHQSLPEEAIRPKNGDTTLFGAPRAQEHHPAAHAHQHVPHLPKARDGTAVAFVSKAAEPNSQYRAYMEDKYCIIDPFMDGELGNETWAFFAVYDGHGGVLAAEHCEAELHKVLASELRHALKSAPKRPSSPLRDEVVAEALTRTFQKADDQLRQVGAWRFGCTATVALVRRLPQGMRVHVANVGDSRAVTVDGSGGSTRLSVDHRPTDAAEARRIREEGGFVTMGRVSGELAVSRALGDLLLKNSGLSCKPSVRAHDAKRDLALVLASDGLWDFAEEKEVAKVVVSCSRNGLDHVAHRLVQEAQRTGSMDNITCLVIFM